MYRLQQSPAAGRANTALSADPFRIFLYSVLTFVRFLPSLLQHTVLILLSLLLLLLSGSLLSAATAQVQQKQKQQPKQKQKKQKKQTEPQQVRGDVQTFCHAFEQKMPHFDRRTCELARLHDSGARSVKGRPILYRDVPAVTHSGSDRTAALQRYAAFHDLGYWLGIRKLPPEEKKPGQANRAALFPDIRQQPVRILVIGCTHGDELTSVALPLQWIAYARQNRTDMHWRFIPSLNPDGLFAQKSTRTNANGVDLNRNFNTPNWQAETRDYWVRRTGRDPRRYPGKSPLSEPESRYLQKQIKTFRPDLIVSVHAPYGVLDYDGPKKPPNKIGSLFLKQVGIYPGSLGNYAGVQQKIPVVTLELKHALELPEPIEMHNMWHDLLVWMRRKNMR